MDIRCWLDHFRKNQLNRREPDWRAPIDVPDAARAALVRSLQQFQLGDGGGPAYLIARDRESFLARDGEVRGLVDLWFAEEKEHSRLLGDALKRFGAEPIEDHWSFSLFCGLRKHLGVAFELNALLLTEIVSNVYYKMLHRYCGDVAVKGMCRLIIRDETGHIRFHRARLAAAGRAPGAVRAGIFRLLGLAAGTTLWVNHRHAIVALGGSTPGFYAKIWEDMGGFVTRLRGDQARLRTELEWKDAPPPVSSPAAVRPLR